MSQNYRFLRPNALKKGFFRLSNLAKVARFAVGSVVRHRLFGYRGVIYDVDPVFQGSDAWYRQMARSRPPRNAPWYRVLVHQQGLETYVAERNLAVDETGAPVEHPQVEQFLERQRDGRYRRRAGSN